MQRKLAIRLAVLPTVRRVRSVRGPSCPVRLDHRAGRFVRRAPQHGRRLLRPQQPGRIKHATCTQQGGQPRFPVGEERRETLRFCRQQADDGFRAVNRIKLRRNRVLQRTDQRRAESRIGPFRLGQIRGQVVYAPAERADGAVDLGELRRLLLVCPVKIGRELSARFLQLLEIGRDLPLKLLAEFLDAGYRFAAADLGEIHHLAMSLLAQRGNELFVAARVSGVMGADLRDAPSRYSCSFLTITSLSALPRLRWCAAASISVCSALVFFRMSGEPDADSWVPIADGRLLLQTR